MANAYLESLQKHLLEEGFIVPKGIMTIEDIVYTNSDETFGKIIIDGEFIPKHYFDDNTKKEVYTMLSDYCKNFLNDSKVQIKVK